MEEVKMPKRKQITNWEATLLKLRDALITGVPCDGLSHEQLSNLKAAGLRFDEETESFTLDAIMDDVRPSSITDGMG
jgi:hypothetical protein